jgi:two-component system response regulator QseB
VKILVVEDDKRISTPVVENLQHEGYDVELSEDGNDALQRASAGDYSLILLDLMIPGVHGVEVCQKLRADGFGGFIVMLTALTSKQDKITGLDSGADDYIRKPFDIDELNACVRSFQRRAQQDSRTDDVLTIGRLVSDRRLRTVRFGDELIPMTPTELRILEHFMRHPDRIFSKTELIEKLWPEDPPATAVVKAHIRALRQKLDKGGVPRDLIGTLYGFGYKLNSSHAQ